MIAVRLSALFRSGGSRGLAISDFETPRWRPCPNKYTVLTQMSNQQLRCDCLPCGWLPVWILCRESDEPQNQYVQKSKMKLD